MSSCHCLLTHVGAGRELFMICPCVWTPIAVGVHRNPIDLPGSFVTQRVFHSAGVHHRKAAETQWLSMNCSAVIALSIWVFIVISAQSSA
jgi:hypothetical protein